jgi:hypothetical protein
MMLPHAFCWTRVGTEAGQSLESILQRKEAERQANGGFFFWGVGNAIGPSLEALLRACPVPEVLFTPIRSAPRRVDVRPEVVAAWTTAAGLDGRHFELPVQTLITSRFDDESTRGHYALVCFSETPLSDELGSGDEFTIGALENFLSGRPVGASQVTAVVRRRGETANVGSSSYRVMMRARLAPPFFLRLSDPIPIESNGNWESCVRARWAATIESAGRQRASVIQLRRA